MRHNKISLPDKPASNPLGIPNDELGSLSVSRHARHEVTPVRRSLGFTQFALLISGNREGLDLHMGIRTPPQVERSSSDPCTIIRKLRGMTHKYLSRERFIQFLRRVL